MTARLAAYGMLGAPLALAALPLHVQLPAYYTQQLGVPIAATGWALFAVRALDTVQDPWLGRVLDRLHGRALRLAMCAAALLLALAFAGLWLPPGSLRQQGAGALAGWLALLLALACLAHSMLTIAHLAWGAQMSADPGVRLGAAGWREGLALAGGMVASTVPPWLAASPGAAAMPWYAGAFALLLAAALALLLRRAPPWRAGLAQPCRGLSPGGSGLAQPASARASPSPAQPCHVSTPPGLAVGQPGPAASHEDGLEPATAAAPPPAVLSAVWRDPAMRRLLPPYALNALATALPATLALFFIRERLQAPALAGWFLGLYFAAAAAGLPLWVRLGRRFGAARAWRTALLLAAGPCAACLLLGPGDVAAYTMLCVLAGALLGADLALPPVLLAQAVGGRGDAAAWHGVWTLVGKLALALASLALPLLSLAGAPFRGDAGFDAGLAFNLADGVPAGPYFSAALACAYAGLPCLLKLAAWRAAAPLARRAGPMQRSLPC